MTTPPFEGYLQKQKTKASLVGNWNKRWFVLDYVTGTFSYYSNRKESTTSAPPGATVRVVDIRSVRSLDGLKFEVDAASRSFVLKAKSEVRVACGASRRHATRETHACGMKCAGGKGCVDAQSDGSFGRRDYG
jgi:hypothetical protein